MKHTHKHRHREMHPHAFGHHVSLEHSHEHEHSGFLAGQQGDGAHHRTHKHTPDQQKELDRQMRRYW